MQGRLPAVPGVNDVAAALRRFSLTARWPATSPLAATCWPSPATATRLPAICAAGPGTSSEQARRLLADWTGEPAGREAMTPGALL